MIFGNPVRQAYIRPPTASPLYGSFRVTQDFGPTSLVHEPSFSWPGGEGISAGYYSHFHTGIDLGNRKCGDDVIAAQSGVVRFAGTLTGGSISVIIDHGGGWSSSYGHLAVEVVSKGQKVIKGQKIGTVGDTGNSTACHLHFAVKDGVSPDYSISYYAAKNGKWRDAWPRLAQNVTVAIRDAGVNIRESAGAGTTPGTIFAASKPDGTIRRKSDNADLGPFAQPRKWGGTVLGATYTLAGVTGKTWEKIDLDGAWRYVATPLAAMSAT